MKENLEKYFYETLEKGKNKDSNYDYLVLFTGGKDSTYIVHLLKKIKDSKICLFTIENGFEKPDFMEKAKNTAKLLGVDIYIYQPKIENFIKYYNFLITEPLLLNFDKNPLCFFCGRYFISLGIEFAERNNIPFVMYGATPEQINKGQEAKTTREIKIFELVSKKFFKNAYEKIQELDKYKQDNTIKNIIDKVFYASDKVKLLFPFQYVNYNINKIKDELEKECGWKNPSDGMSNKNYLSSGCNLVNLFGVLKNKAGFEPHELEQFKKDFDKGILNKEAYEYNIKLFENVMKGNITTEIKNLMKKLNLDSL